MLFRSQLSSSFASAVGKAIASVFSLSPQPTHIVIGRDTRASGPELEEAVSQGIRSMGAHTTHVGVVPSGCISYLAQKNHFAAGVMISASHNAHTYNGIKVFAANGFKSSDEYESKIEHQVAQNMFATSPVLGKKTNAAHLSNQFVFYLKSLLPETMANKKFAIDCANGAAYQLARQVFASFKGATFLHCTPNGTNINEGCGATNLAALSSFVVKHGYHFGMAFDGDADRIQAVDESGKTIDGDMLLYAFAKHMKQKDTLSKSAIACTTLSNSGLISSLKKCGINCHVTDVGDKAVSHAILSNNLCLGGEQSGHIIFQRKLNTGDGLVSACMLLDLVQSTNVPFSQLFSGFVPNKQVQINVQVSPSKKLAILNNADLQLAINQIAHRLNTHGRVLVRASGTEPVIRVLIEGKTLSTITRLATSLAQQINNFK